MIETSHLYPPIPDRSHDWHAHFDYQFADDLSVEGYGKTEESAVIDLLQNAIESDNERDEHGIVIDLALAGWNAKKNPSEVAALKDLHKWIKARADTHGSLSKTDEGSGLSDAHKSMQAAYESAAEEIAGRIARAKG